MKKQTDDIMVQVEEYEPLLWTRTETGKVVPFFFHMSQLPPHTIPDTIPVTHAPETSKTKVKRQVLFERKRLPAESQSRFQDLVWDYHDACQDSGDFQTFETLVQLGHSNHLMEVLEPHRDVWAEQFCDEGASTYEVLHYLRAAASTRIVAETYMSALKYLDAKYGARHRPVVPLPFTEDLYASLEG